MPPNRRAQRRQALKTAKSFVFQFQKRIRLIAAFGIFEPNEMKSLKRGLKSLDNFRAKVRNRLKDM